MLLSDLLEQCKENPEMLTDVLKLLDMTVKYIHSKGFFIIDFNPQKIILVNNTPDLNNFKSIISPIDYDPTRDININIYQMAKIGLMAFNNIIVDGKMNQDHYNFIVYNIKKFNQNSRIPEEIYEYYEDLFINGNINYLNDYLESKKQEAGRETNLRKTLASEAGRALSSNKIEKQDNNAFVNILFIPSILALLYLIGLFIYTFILK